MSIPMMKNAIRHNRLHLIVCSAAPDSIRSWAEVGVAGLELNSFFTEIRSTIVDPLTIAAGKIPTKKVEVTNMRDKVTKALAEPPTLEAITLLQQDLSQLFKSILEMSDPGVPFTKHDVGTDREEMDKWRADIMLSHTAREEKEDTEKAQVESYQKATKTQKLPQITQGDWGKFLYILRSEVKLYASDQIRLNVILGLLVDQVDKSATEHCTSLNQILGYLYRRYGTESTVFLNLLTEVMNLGKPKNDKEEEQNLAREGAVTSISTSPQNIALYTSDNDKQNCEQLFQ